MSFWKLSDRDKDTLLRKYERGLLKPEDSASIGVQHVTLERYCRQYRENKAHERKRYAAPILEGYEYSIIISDLHIPYHSQKVISDALEITEYLKLPKWLMAGDILDFSQSSFTTHPIVSPQQNPINTQQSITILKNLLKELTGMNVRSNIFMGNHDWRLAKKTDGELYLGMFIDSEDHVVSPYANSYLSFNDGSFANVIHPVNYSADPVRLAQEFYNVERGPSFDPFNPKKTSSKGDIILAHTHRFQRGLSPDGIYDMIGLPAANDPALTEYINMQPAKNKKSDQGFLLVWDRHYYPIIHPFTNWDVIRALRNTA